MKAEQKAFLLQSTIWKTLTAAAANAG